MYEKGSEVDNSLNILFLLNLLIEYVLHMQIYYAYDIMSKIECFYNRR